MTAKKKKELTKPEKAMREVKLFILDLHRAAGIEWDERDWGKFIGEILNEVAEPIAKSMLLNKLGVKVELVVDDNDEDEPDEAES
jgi:hypothetical protein